MQKSQNHSKNKSKYNKKKKVVNEHETGMLDVVRQNARVPITFLPEITSSPIYSTIRRFISSGGATSGTLTIQDILNQFMYAETTVLGRCYVKAIRIKRIRLLSPVTTQGTSVTARLQPVTADGGNNSFSAVPETYIDTSASIDLPAYIKLRPSIDTPLGSWHFSSTVNAFLFAISCPQGSTLDLTIDYILNDEFTASAYTVVIAAATPGTMFSRAISNLTPAKFNVL